MFVKIQDTHSSAVSGVEIEIEGIGGSGVTGDDGKAKLSVGAATKEGDSVSFAILHSPPGRDYVMISPWDSRAAVPSFENKADNFIKVVVVQRGDRAALEDGSVLVSLAEKINKRNTPARFDKQAELLDSHKNLEEVAEQYGLSADEVDSAIRNWGAKTKDPYEAGMAALYERDYPKASMELENSLKLREAQLKADQKQVADAAFFLGSSLYQQGRYRESGDAYEKCLKIHTDDPIVLNNTALSLEYAGDYAGAEPLLRRALAIDERDFGPDDPYVAANLNNLAQLLEAKGDYAGAEPLVRRSLAIDEKTLGPDHPYLSANLNNLAELLKDKRDYSGAEPLLRQSLAIDEKTLGPDHPDTAIRLNNLAELLKLKGDYAGAELLVRRSLAIDEKTFGPDHPDTAIRLNNLAELLKLKGDYAGAEPLLRQALAINEKVLGPDHPKVATNLNNLAALLEAEGDYVRAEPFLRQALAIDEKALGPDHPTTRAIQSNLDKVLHRPSKQKEP